MKLYKYKNLSERSKAFAILDYLIGNLDGNDNYETLEDLPDYGEVDHILLVNLDWYRYDINGKLIYAE